MTPTTRAQVDSEGRCWRCYGWGFTPDYLGNINQPCRDCGGVNIKAKRGHTIGNVYNYRYWACPKCEYHPGSADGPPGKNCLNCGESQFHIQPKEWEPRECQRNYQR
jgi:hypothetical protein